jgi:hypothetical protein
MYGKVPMRESEALRTLFDAADGRNWTKRDNWKQAPGTENTWYGISCDAGNTRVLKIALRNNNLAGTLPAELSDLSNLQTLLLSDNQLRGAHPDLGKLSKLTTLDLSNNSLSGAFPRWIRKLKNLRELDLSYNRLTGGIPSWIGELKNLEVLLLDGNRLSGSLPKELANLSKLAVLRVGHNHLTGEIPFTIGKLVRLAGNKSNFKWNALYTLNASMKDFLKQKQAGKDWESTQTVAPPEITTVSLSNTSIMLRWGAIAYTEDKGGYQVFYSEKPGGPYQMAGATEDKTITQLEVRDLKPSTTYYFVVRSWTAPHGSNRNKVDSGYSKEITATTRGTTISGAVKTAEGQGIPGVEINASDEGGNTFSDSRGNYHLSVTPRWSGVVTPAKKGYNFSPPSLDYENVTGDRDGQDYTAEASTKISGQVTDMKGKGVTGITLTFYDKEGKTSAKVESDAGGNYVQTVTYDWAGTVIPSKTGYIFEPTSREYTGVTDHEAGKGYKARMLPAIGGSVKTRRGKRLPGVQVVFSTRGKKTPESFSLVTGEKGEYSKIFEKEWSGRVKPAKTGYRFYPSKRNYKGITLDNVKKAEHYRAEMDLKFFIAVTGNYTIPAESNFDEIYGKSLISPEISAGFKFYRNFYIWGAYGFSSKNGVLPIFEEPSKWKETLLSLGLGYNGNLSVLLGYKIDVGVSFINYSEEAFGDFMSEKTVGMRVDGAGIFKVSDRLFTEISMGYVFASDTVGEISIKLGGLKAGFGLGLRF